jgi:hypothetical protein
MRYSAGRWRGNIELEPGKPIPIYLPGTWTGPLQEAAQLAEHAQEWWMRVRAAVAKELFEHYSNGREGGLSGLPDIASDAEVWMHVTLSSVEIRPHRSLDELQVAIRTTWDDEHTLGALVRDAVLVELNGSILEPR